MAAKSTGTRWGSINKLMHWSLVLVLAGVFISVWCAMDLERGDPMKGTLMMLHKSFAATALLLMVSWRLMRPKLGRPTAYGAAWQVKASNIGHWALILFVIAMPIGGVLMSQLFQSPLVIFNVIPVPQILAENKELGSKIMDIHRLAGPTLFFIILAHIAGALWHHFIDKDETLKRMLPGKK